jgi:hypothetical protein
MTTKGVVKIINTHKIKGYSTAAVVKDQSTVRMVEGVALSFAAARSKMRLVEILEGHVFNCQLVGGAEEICKRVATRLATYILCPQAFLFGF